MQRVVNVVSPVEHWYRNSKSSEGGHVDLAELFVDNDVTL